MALGWDWDGYLCIYECYRSAVMKSTPSAVVAVATNISYVATGANLFPELHQKRTNIACESTSVTALRQSLESNVKEI